MRAKSVSHVEYEILRYVLDRIDIEQVKNEMCPSGDTVAEKRFNTGHKNAAQLIKNLCERRRHRLPENHVDYKEKDE